MRAREEPGSPRSPSARTRRVGAGGAGGALWRAYAVPARPRPPRALEALSAPQGEDAGVHRPRGRPLPHPDDAHARDDRDLARRGTGAAPQRGPRRGDRPRSRHGAHAVRSRGRAGARRRAREQRSGFTSGTTSSRGGSPAGSTSRTRSATASSRTRASRSRRRSRARSCASSTGSPTSTTTSTTRFATGSSPTPTCRGTRSSSSGPPARSGSTGSSTTWSRRRSRQARSGRRAEIGEAMLSLRSFMFERVYLGPQVAPEHRRADEVVQSIFARLVARAGAAAGRRRRDRRTDHRLHLRDDRSLRPRVRCRPVVARIKDQSVRDVVAAANIVDVVSLRTSLRKSSGTRFMGRCPFHDERSPSFSVNSDLNVYYCFGCGKGGDVVTFVRETEGLDFVGAIEWLAERFRVPLEYEAASPEADESRRRRERLFAVLDQAAAFFERHLWEGAEGEPVRAYLESRGLREDDLEGVPAGALAGRRAGAQGSREGVHGRRVAGGGADEPARQRLLPAAPDVPARRRARQGDRLPGPEAPRRRPAARASTSTRPRASCSRRAASSTGSTWRGPRSRSRTGRWSSRATPT